MRITSIAKRFAVATAGLALAAGTAAAQPQGVLNIDGSLTLTTAGGLFIDILEGNVVRAGAGNTGSFAGIAANQPGTMLDFAPAVGPAVIPGILTIGGFTFDLSQVFAGVFSNAACGAPSSIGDTCTPTGTAFNLVNTAAGQSTASFAIGGTVMGASGMSPFTGIFTAQFNQPFEDVIAAALTPGGITTTFSASFEASVVPEPSTYALMGTGLLALAGVASRRRRA